jgi:hypothetical protein
MCVCVCILLVYYVFKKIEIKNSDFASWCWAVWVMEEMT